MSSLLKTAKYSELFDYDRFPLITDPKTGKKHRIAYGRIFPGNPCDVSIEMWCAAKRLRVEDGGLGEFKHYKNILQALYPYLVNEWTHWLDMQLELYTGPCGTHTILGGGGCGKSWFLGTMDRLWQAANPLRRGVMIINTTQKSQSQRAWKYVIDCQQAFPWLPGEIANIGGDPCLSVYEQIPHPRKEDRFLYQVKPGVGIISQTVKQGKSARATADLKGMHPPELQVTVEEANHQKRTSLQRGRANWITNDYYQIILTGNPEIEDIAGSDTENEDSLYHLSTPLHGWGSIEWGKTRKWKNKFGGITIHLDPYDSPRIHEPKRFVVSSWLPDLEYIEKKAQELGGENTPLFKQQIRGIYDHEALPFNPITLAMCEKYAVRVPARFTGYDNNMWAAFDPAYSGKDEAFLKIARTGIVESGKKMVDFLGTKTNLSFKLDSNSGDEASYQMLKWVRQWLDFWKVPYENFIMDANLIGIGLGDIFTKELSRDIHKVIVMGKPSEEYLDLAETYTAADRCANKATEMWIAFQQFMIAEQIAGLDDSIIDQLIEMPASVKGGKIKVLEKEKFRAKFGYSPDRAECALFIIELLRKKGFKHGYSNQNEVDTNDLFMPTPLSIDQIFINMGPTPYTEAKPRTPTVGFETFFKKG